IVRPTSPMLPTSRAPPPYVHLCPTTATATAAAARAASAMALLEVRRREPVRLQFGRERCVGVGRRDAGELRLEVRLLRVGDFTRRERRQGRLEAAHLLLRDARLDQFAEELRLGAEVARPPRAPDVLERVVGAGRPLPVDRLPAGVGEDVALPVL